MGLINWIICFRKARRTYSNGSTSSTMTFTISVEPSLWSVPWRHYSAQVCNHALSHLICLAVPDQALHIKKNERKSQTKTKQETTEEGGGEKSLCELSSRLLWIE